MATHTSSPEEKTVVDTDGREAIIFIPAIGRGWDDPSIEGVARRMAVAIDRQSITEEAKANVEIAEQEYGVGYKCRMFTITKSDGKTVRPLIDVFGMDYNDTLVESYAKRNLFFKTILLAFTLVGTFFRLGTRFYKKGKSIKEKIQLFYGLLVFSLLVVYLVFLIAAGVSSAEQLRNLAKDKPQPKVTAMAPQTEQIVLGARQLQVQSVVGDVLKVIWNWVQTGFRFVWGGRNYFPPIIVLMTALGFALPAKAKIKEKISIAATNYLCLIHYLTWGERSHAIGGKLEALLEHLVEREKKYGRIHIIGYSFGSIVALDSLFASGRRPIDRFSRIDTLVTIGCPFDMIRTYWPDYFKKRRSITPNNLKWINVYSPIDVLSSNFCDGGNDQTIDKSKDQSIGVEVDGQISKPESIMFSQGVPQSLGVVNILTLAGFKAHSLYWGEEVRGEITCFHDIVRKMYRGTPILS